MRPGRGDLVETAAWARLLRLAIADGSLIDLGPGTRARRRWPKRARRSICTNGWRGRSTTRFSARLLDALRRKPG